jgi:hypothetical protein
MAKKKIEPTVEAIEDWDTLEPTGEMVIVGQGPSNSFICYVNVAQSGKMALVDESGDIYEYDWSGFDNTREYIEAIANGDIEDYLHWLGYGKVVKHKEHWKMTFAKSIGWETRGLMLVDVRRRGKNYSSKELHKEVAMFFGLYEEDEAGNMKFPFMNSRYSVFMKSDAELADLPLKVNRKGQYVAEATVAWDEHVPYTQDEIRSRARKALRNDYL